jgi:hypothetical protein
MAPLIPNEIINPAWNNVLALLLGMAFGFVLEASGFSSSRKIMGTFFGYDFVVLKVFFTGAITAMVGILYFNHMGILDINLLYIHPTYLTSAITGGIIMGLGFAFGGYCPGTSYSAVAIGKIDAILFTIGLFLGVFIFSGAYPFIENILFSRSLGPVLASDIIGISPELLVFLIIVVSLGIFAGTVYIEKRAKKVDY